MRRFLTASFMATVFLALPAVASAVTPVWLGTWDTSRGPLTITSEGGQLTGAFGYSDSWNEPLGHIKAAASGNTLTGTWSHDEPSHFAPLDHGSITLTLTMVGGKETFNGPATYEANGSTSSWSGSCTSGACAEDREAPTVTAMAATGKAGKTVTLRYRVTENSGKSSETVAVYRGSARIWGTTVALRDVTSGATYAVSFKAPPRAGTLRFTVQARDAAKNASQVSSAAISVR